MDLITGSGHFLERHLDRKVAGFNDTQFNVSDPLGGNNTNGSNPCPAYVKMEHLEEKLCLVGILGTLVAMSGIISNSLLVYVFFRPSVRLQTVLYLAVLAMLDIWMLITYILIFPFNIWYDYLESLPLFRFWIFYVRPMLTISKMIQMASTYLIVAATLERYLSQVGVSCTRNKRGFVIFMVIFSSILLKATTYLEVNVIHRPGCEGFSENDIVTSQLVQNPLYRKVVLFYMNHIIQVFLPFALLLALNVLIISRMKRHTSTMARNETVRSIATYPTASIMFFKARREDYRSVVLNNNKAHAQISQRIESKKQLREATHMLIMIVFLYLIVNSVSLVVTTMEHTSSGWLETHQTFYTFAVDTISFLSVINSSVRVLVYYFFNGTIRSEFAKLFCRCTRNYTPADYNYMMQRMNSDESLPKRSPKVTNGYANANCNESLTHPRHTACDICADNSVALPYHSHVRTNQFTDYGNLPVNGIYPPHYETCV